MKMLTEYLDRAVEFEKLAASEDNEAFKAQLLKQAAEYRRLAAKRAKEYGLPMRVLRKIANQKSCFNAKVITQASRPAMGAMKRSSSLGGRNLSSPNLIWRWF
jgi:hypothetical protein